MAVLLTRRHAHMPMFIATVISAGAFLVIPHALHAQFTDFSSISGGAAGAPAAPLITSSAFPEPERWYNAAEGAAFRFEIPEGASAVAAQMVDEPTEEPTFVYEPAVSQFAPKESELHEGVQYAAVQFRNANGWGAIGYRKLQLDFTPPVGLYIDIAEDDAIGVSTLHFGAEDALSGVAGYAVYHGGEGPFYLTPEEASRGYALPQDEVGMRRVVVVAYDRAGNSISNHFPVFVLPREASADELWFGEFATREIAALALSLATFGMFFFALMTRRKYAEKESRLKLEMYEIQEQMEKIFTALKNEIFDQIQSLNARKRLTKGEKEAVEHLNRALEVSETLVKKEMKDVKKILK